MVLPGGGYLPSMIEPRGEPSTTEAFPDAPILINTRVLLNPLTGVQRYTTEHFSRMGDLVHPVQPPLRMTSVLNQGWEQFVLPLHARGRILWSPANTGPLAVENQVLTLHDLAPLDHPEWYHGPFARYLGWLLPRLARRVRHIITVSAFSRDRIVALTGVSSEKISVIHSAAAAGFTPRPEQEIHEACAEQGLAPGGYFLYVGSIEPRKNLARLLRAWASCRPRLPGDLVLAVVGERANPRAFKSVALPGEAEGVRWLGRVPDPQLPALMSGAMAFVYVSLYEGFGAPPVEAMAAGTPVLTSAAASLPEVVGEAALTVDPTDDDAIAEGLVRLAGDAELRARLREMGLARAAEFSWDRAVVETRELFARML